MESPEGENCHNLRHASGEIGCRGYLPSTWELYAELIIGYVPERTPINEAYVTQKILQRWLDNGKTEKQIFLVWNQGTYHGCRKGVNAKGIPYDSCGYVQSALALLDKDL